MSSAALIVDHRGGVVRLGERLGTGGEGSVFTVPAAELVAKLYHEPLTADRHAKLLSMVDGCNEALRAIAAWPTALLHAGSGGQVRGFLMPRLERHLAIHNVYGPANRKVQHPKADWAFLIRVARNLAAAFDTIHAHGHVIGDVNQGNVFVAADAVVKLIDCDSFQVASERGQFFCDVGVPHFTPPELQQLPSFHALPRTAHHDNFGLAVLIFHLLFMGRHPFAGVYLGRGDMPIERAIKEFKYVFARDAAVHGMRRPPASVGPELVTAELSQLFEQAFRKDSGPIERPTARRWLECLERLECEIRTCATEAMHRYYSKLAACPWCELESHGVFYFMGEIALSLTPPAGFDLEALWRDIEAARAQLPVMPARPRARVLPTPLPPRRGIAADVMAMALSFVFLVGAILLSPLLPVFLGWMVVGVWCLVLLARNPRQQECERRLARERIAEQRWFELEQQWRDAAGIKACQQRYQQLSAARREYEGLEDACRRAKAGLERTVRERQLRNFLSQFHIDAAVIALISPSHQATLASFGIETAADVERSRIAGLPGFTVEPSDALVAWRRVLESRFQFDGSGAVEPHAVLEVTRRFAQRRRQLAAVLSSGAEELQNIITAHEAQHLALLPALESAALDLAQARADVSLV